MIFIILD